MGYFAHPPSLFIWFGEHDPMDDYGRFEFRLSVTAGKRPTELLYFLRPVANDFLAAVQQIEQFHARFAELLNPSPDTLSDPNFPGKLSTDDPETKECQEALAELESVDRSIDRMIASYDRSVTEDLWYTLQALLKEFSLEALGANESKQHRRQKREAEKLRADLEGSSESLHILRKKNEQLKREIITSRAICANGRNLSDFARELNTILGL
ncbi:hypothetical protein B0H63DRAFT_526007 [Podospora didyma]|uniref:Uncharacterized protein n=1 Tax=Podospora didyma TaxID=330526 RepID=A0AAE0N960_9PEZI|nr:hypothetical protein B0H63DRAFT_526007 [Podospora didyma]